MKTVLPKYSVLMSVYAKEKNEFFRLAIDSMLNQTVAPDEIVIVEDGPLTEELYATLRNFKERYPQIIQIVKIEKNVGLGKALNKGLIECKNQLVARMDTDDISLRERCEKQLVAFSKDISLDICGTGTAQFINSTDNIVSKSIYPNDDAALKKFAKKRCPFNHMTVMFKKESVLDVGNYQDWHLNEDYFLWIRMMRAKMKFANIPEILVYSRVGNDRNKRRGGIKYFKSNFRIECFMYRKKIISLPLCLYNIAIRFFVQIMLPSSIRGFLFKLVER